MSEDWTKNGQSAVSQSQVEPMPEILGSADESEPQLIVNKVQPEATGELISPSPRKFKPSNNVRLLEQDPIEEEQISRLQREVVKERKKPDQVKFEKLEEKPAQDVQQEEQWGKRSVVLGKWLVVGGLAIMVVIVSAVFLSPYIKGDEMEEVEAPEIVVNEPHPYEGSPEKWFRQNDVILEKQALDILGKYVSLESIEARSKFVRDPERYLRYVSSWPKEVLPRLDNPRENRWLIGHTNDRAFFRLNTLDKNFLPTSLYFIRLGDQLKLDWFASTAWSEISFPKFLEAPDDDELSSEKTVLLRCLLRRREEFYAGPYNEQEHASYMILSPDKEHYFWMYVTKGSDLDEKLRTMLDHGRFVVSLKKDIRVTLRIRRGKKDALPLQVELVELVHSNWVKP